MAKQEIAEIYASQAVHTTDRLKRSWTLAAYGQLASESSSLYWSLRDSGLDVMTREVDEPYRAAQDMFLDIGLNRITVSTNNLAHPLWDNLTNFRFRVVHDVLGHYASKGGFNWKGEIKAYLAQAENHSPLAQSALFTEIIGQTAYRSVYGQFPEQKVFLYPQSMIDEFLNLVGV